MSKKKNLTNGWPRKTKFHHQDLKQKKKSTSHASGKKISNLNIPGKKDFFPENISVRAPPPHYH